MREQVAIGMIKLVIFDWNGTILSDAAANLEAENRVLSLFNIEPITIKQYRERFEVPPDEVLCTPGH